MSSVSKRSVSVRVGSVKVSVSIVSSVSAGTGSWCVSVGSVSVSSVSSVGNLIVLLTIA